MALAKPSSFTIRPPTKAVDLAPKYGQKAMFTGMTGSGKTTGILNMLPAYYGKQQIIIADTKGDPALERLYGPTATKLRDLPKVSKWPDNPVVLYRPNGNELADLTILDAFCDWIYRRGNTVLVLDEIGQFARGAYAGPGLTNVYARGRTQKVTVLGGTQRPKNVPLIAFTESQWFFTFRLLYLNDRKRMGEYAHPSLIEAPTSPYGVKVYQVGTQEPIEYVSLTK